MLMDRNVRMFVAWIIVSTLMAVGVLLVAAWTEVDISVGEAIVGGMVGGGAVLWLLTSKR